jgi:hypothetical protein
LIGLRRVGLAAFVLDLAEADEGVHLVKVVTDLMGERAELRDVRIGVYVQKFFVGLQTPEDAIEEVPAAGVAMTRDSGGGVEKLPRDEEGCSRFRVDRRLRWSEEIETECVV